MIEYTTGNIFEAQTEALVNPVNCVGVMGKGLALQFKKKYPANFYAYRDACGLGLVKLGRVHVFRTGLDIPRHIFNFPTKHHWRERSDLKYIKAGLRSLEEKITTYNVKSIAIPPLGAGLGQLDKRLVVLTISLSLTSISPDVRVLIFTGEKE